jgi:hypothetical protein
MKQINHIAFINIYNKNKDVLTYLFKDTKTLGGICYKINKIANNYLKYDLVYVDENKVKGDLFEIFAECFFKVLSADNRVGVYNYECNTNDDYGVDGFGIGINEQPLTVQVKFRSDVLDELTEKDIKQFAFQSVINFNVDKDSKQNMIVFTNAKGLHWVTENKVYENRVKTLGYNELRILIDNNTVFWKDCLNLINYTLKSKYGIDVDVENEKVDITDEE